VGAALGILGDPIGKLLGVSKQFPCNGNVFSDAVPFTGSGLGRLPFTPTGFLPQAEIFSFQRSYTDEATHNTDICGHIAETDVTFSVLRLPFLPVKFYGNLVFPTTDLRKGLRQLGTGSVRSVESDHG
jgi:hypothetical protein